MESRTPWDARKGAIIRRRRQALGWEQRDLAERVGVHVNSVQRWESGSQAPARKLGKLEHVLGIVIDDAPPEPDEPPVPPELEGMPEVVESVRRRFPGDLDAQARVLDAMARAMRGEGPPPANGPGTASGAPSRDERRRAG